MSPSLLILLNIYSSFFRLFWHFFLIIFKSDSWRETGKSGWHEAIKGWNGPQAAMGRTQLQYTIWYTVYQVRYWGASLFIVFNEQENKQRIYCKYLYLIFYLRFISSTLSPQSHIHFFVHIFLIYFWLFLKWSSRTRLVIFQFFYYKSLKIYKYKKSIFLSRQVVTVHFFKHYSNRRK